MSAILRAHAVDALLDWSRIFAGELTDDISGLSWAPSVTFAQDDGLFGGPGAKFAGNSYIAMRGLTWATDWTVVTFVRCDTLTGWAKLWETNIAPGYGPSYYNDYVSCMTLPAGQYGIPGSNVSTHLTTPGGAGATTLAHVDDFGGGANIVTVVKRGNQLTLWLNTHQSAPVTVGELSEKPRTLLIGVEHTLGSATYWRGAVGSVGFWRRALSDAEIISIYREAMTASAQVTAIPQVSDFYPTILFTHGIPVVPGMSRVDGLSGAGSIVGTVKVKNRPIARVVYCEDQITGVRVGETWPDPITGAYRFDGLALDRIWFVHSHDHEREYNAAVADYRYAEVEP